MTTTVFVLQRGVDYEGNDLLGLFSTLEKAMAAFPDARWTKGKTYWRATKIPDGLTADALWIGERTLDTYQWRNEGNL